jgi:hypothetical protein
MIDPFEDSGALLSASERMFDRRKVACYLNGHDGL